MSRFLSPNGLSSFTSYPKRMTKTSASNANVLKSKGRMNSYLPLPLLVVRPKLFLPWKMPQFTCDLALLGASKVVKSWKMITTVNTKETIVCVAWQNQLIVPTNCKPNPLSVCNQVKQLLPIMQGPWPLTKVVPVLDPLLVRVQMWAGDWVSWAGNRNVPLGQHSLNVVQCGQRLAVWEDTNRVRISQPSIFSYASNTTLLVHTLLSDSPSLSVCLSFSLTHTHAHMHITLNSIHLKISILSPFATDNSSSWTRMTILGLFSKTSVSYMGRMEWGCG